MGGAKQKSAFEHVQNAKCIDSAHPGHVQSIIQAFALH